MLQKYNRLQLEFSRRKNSSTGEEKEIYHLSLKMLSAFLHLEDKKESAPFTGVTLNKVIDVFTAKYTCY